MFVFVISTRDRARTAVLRASASARMALASLVGWVRIHREMALADERGLTAAEYVVLGAVVVVAAGAVGTLIAAFLRAKTGQIIGTP